MPHMLSGDFVEEMYQDFRLLEAEKEDSPQLRHQFYSDWINDLGRYPLPERIQHNMLLSRLLLRQAQAALSIVNDMPTEQD